MKLAVSLSKRRRRHFSIHSKLSVSTPARAWAEHRLRAGVSFTYICVHVLVYRVSDPVFLCSGLSKCVLTHKMTPTR